MNCKKNETSFHLAGWLLFLICSLLFLYVSARDGDTILALASLVFLGGCIAFLIPLVFPDLVKEAPAGREGADSSVES